MINAKEVKHLATLARLGLSKKELQKLGKDLEGILAYVGELGKADVKGVEPVSHITGLENREREDVFRERISSPERLLKAVPEKKGRWVKVMRIISK